MNEQNKKVPTVRFKSFTNDWEQRKGKDIFHSKSNKGFPELTVLSATQDKGMIPRDANGIDIKYEKKSLKGYKKVNPGDFVVHLRSFQGGFAYSGLTGIVSPAYTIFTFKQPEMFNDYFWKEKFTSYNFIQLLKKVTYGVRDGRSISYSDFLTLNEKFPSKIEQDKIGKLLKQINDLVTLQQRKLDFLKQLKKGLLQKMFTDKDSKQPILRFNGFNDDWECRKLENSADYIRGSFPQPYGNKEWYGGTNAKPFVQVVDVNTNMRLNKKTKEQISVLAQPKSRFVPSGSIVVTLQGSIGRVAITQYDSYVDRTLLIFTKYKVPVDKYFWAYSIQNNFRIEKQKAPGGTIKTITKRALSSFEVSLPVQEEQKKIGTLLKNIDDIITSQQEEVSKLKKIKKSLLQQMFI